MLGTENIIRMRLNGRKPSVVWIEMLPMQDACRQFTERPGRNVDIHIDRSDISSIDRADLRCVVDTHVIVNGPDTSETERVAQACFNSGARVVEAFFFNLRMPTNPEIVKAMRFSPDGVKTVWPK